MKMYTADIEWSHISRFRTELMGVAMLIILLFHVDLPRHDTFFGLYRLGNLGVDFFLFLSGVGLWFAWSKGCTLRQFYYRRFIRIYPTWLLVATVYFTYRYAIGKSYAHSWPELLGEVLCNWCFWTKGELTFWYIPAIMALYLVAPPYMRLLQRHPVYRWLPLVGVLWCIMVEWVSPLHSSVGHLEIFWSRVPIFFIGINVGEMVQQRQRVDGAAVGLLVLLVAITAGSVIYLEQVRRGLYPLFVERMLYIPLTVALMLLLPRILLRAPQWLLWPLRTVGVLSLEFYLLHQNLVLSLLPRAWSYWPTFACCVVLTFPAAWVLHQVTQLIEKRLNK